MIDPLDHAPRYYLDLKKIFWCAQVMVDPDAPSPSDPSLREYLHW
jgi:hypothetical protein